MIISIESRIKNREEQAAFERLLALGFQNTDESEYELETNLDFAEVEDLAQPIMISLIK